jgi:DNA-binding PadR family transcriptional regulator
VSREVTGPKREKITESGRKLHKAEFHDPYQTPSFIRMMKWRSKRWTADSTYRENTNEYKVSVGKPNRETLLENLRFGGR